MLQTNSVHPAPSEQLARLAEIRSAAPASQTRGLSDGVIQQFLQTDALLAEAIEAAAQALQHVQSQHLDLTGQDEKAIAAALQDGRINFYAADAVNPYVALAARGPWIITLGGAVLHDSGGYGMLGLGHSPKVVLDAMNRHQVMANVMTPSLSHQQFITALRGEIGQTRGGCPYGGFMCLNSGSESMTVALRMADINAKLQTDPDGPHRGKPIRRVALEKSFHGRTDRPAGYSDSTLQNYVANLASFRTSSGPITIQPNNIDQLREVFQMADEQGFFIEAVCIEPVMGEGNPGLAMQRDFYDVARELTLAHSSMLIIDSIQAGLRTHGYLSVVDYPGFADCVAPDMETYSKALNAGQYPLSVLALTQRVIDIFRPGIYGNTMTSNPRALDVACSVLGSIDDKLRQNIRDRGAEFVRCLRELADELGENTITSVQGTGLLLSCELDETYLCYGAGSTEEYMRHNGIGVVHGGQRSLRFTPPFAITSAEIGLIIDVLRDALVNGPKKA